MKSLQKLFVFLAVLGLALTSCQREISSETGNNGNITAQWEFKEGSSQFKGPVDTAYIEDLNGIKTLTVEGTTADQKDEFLLEVFGTTLSVGTYSGPVAYFEYYSGAALQYVNDITTNKFTVTITSITADGVTGTFSGEVKDALGNAKTIKEGKFSGSFITVPKPPTGSGQVTFWAKQGCTTNAELVVQINGQKDTITAFHATGPGCGATGTAFFTLPAGSYDWKAYCIGSTDTTRGTTSITSGNCIAEEVVPGGVVTNPTACKIANMGFYDLSNGGVPWGAQIFTFNNLNAVTSLKMVDSGSTPAVVQIDYAIVTTASRVSIDGGTKYFDIGPGGKVSGYTGYGHPLAPSGTKYIWRYEYNANDEMIKATAVDELAPSIILFTVNNVWVNGNMMESKKTYVDGSYDKVTYTYDNSKVVKTFVYAELLDEIDVFQGAINYGKTSVNLPLTAKYIETIADGTITTTNQAEFKNYTFDANGYVKTFDHMGSDYMFWADTRYVLTYKCF